MQLIERVGFSEAVTVPDDYGGQTETLTERFETRAKFHYLRGGETVQAARLEGRQPVVVTVRKQDAAEAVTTDWVVTDKRRGDVYNVRTGPLPTDDRRYVEFLCESGVAV